MTSTTRSRRSSWGLVHPLPDSFQLGGANLSSIIGFRHVHPIDEMRYIGLFEYPSRQSTAFVRNTHNAAEITAREEPYDVESPPVTDQQVTTNNSDLVGPLEPLLNDNPWVEEVTNFVVASHTAAERDLRPSVAAFIRSKLVRALLGGVLSLIVLPGIILGLLVNAMAGIALSSAITGLASLVAGLYYYLNKRD